MREPSTRPSRLADPRPWLLALGVVLVLLALTGLWQSFHYRPELVPPAPRRSPAAQSWEDIYTLQTIPPAVQGAGWVSAVHRQLARAFVVLALVVVATVVLRWVRARRVDAIALAWLALGTTALVAALRSGHALPWQGFGLRVVRIDQHIEGLWDPAYGSWVRFFTFGADQVSQREYRTDLLAHVVAVPVILATVVAALRHRLRHDAPPPSR